MSTEIVIILILIGLSAGILSGLVGVGGGIIVVPALIYFLSFSQFQAQGTSLGLLLLPVGIFAVMNYYQKGYIDIRVVGIMAIAFVAGGFLGSKLALNIPVVYVKRVFAILLFYTGIKMMGWDVVMMKWIRSMF